MTDSPSCTDCGSPLRPQPASNMWKCPFCSRGHYVVPSDNEPIELPERCWIYVGPDWRFPRNWSDEEPVFSGTRQEMVRASLHAALEQRVRELENTLQSRTARAEMAEADVDIQRQIAVQSDLRLAALREAAAKVCEGFDQGVFIRSTAGDDDPAWAIKLFPYVQAIGKLAATAAGGEG